MRLRNNKLILRLGEISRQQAPDHWSRLRDRLQEGKAPCLNQEGTSVQADAAMTKRSVVPMKRKTTWIAATAAAAVVVAVILTIVFMQPEPPPVEFKAGETVTLANGSLFINAVTPNTGKIRMPPDADTVDLTLEDLTKIFGRPPIPALPDGYKMSSDTISAMMFRVGTVFIMNGITFSKDPENPEAAQVMFDLNDQGELPIADCGFGAGQTSVLEGVEIMLGIQTIEGDKGSFEMFTAEFVNNDIGYRIRATHLSADEFISILETVIKG
jgi:hypothetical protein